MATKFQVELALKAILLELQNRGENLHRLRDKAILRMYQQKLFINEDSLKERGAAEEKLFELILQVAGEDHASPRDTISIEEF